MSTHAPRDLSRYLRLARTENGAGLRLALAIVAGTVGFFLVTIAALLVVVLVERLGGRDLVIDSNNFSPDLLLGTNLGLALCIPLAGALSVSAAGNNRIGCLASRRDRG